MDYEKAMQLVEAIEGTHQDDRLREYAGFYRAAEELAQSYCPIARSYAQRAFVLLDDWGI